MPSTPNRFHRSHGSETGVFALPALALLLALVPACGGGDDTAAIAAFVLRATSHAVAGTTPLLGDLDELVYLLDEATTGPGGTDFNADGDELDSVPVRVNTATGATQVVGVDADSSAFLNGTLFIEVQEVLGSPDWNGDLDFDDRVLLYHRIGALAPEFLVELSDIAATPFVVAGDKLIVATAATPSVMFETNLSFTTVPTRGAAPSALQRMVSTISDIPGDGVSLQPARAIGDVVFLTADENVDGNLNGDLDATDTAILAVLDAGEAAPTVLGLGLALSSATACAVEAIGGDWLAAFLVSEPGQGVNLNDAALFAGTWQPPNCNGREDVDQLDHVLHWFLMSDLVATMRVVNTGLVGPLAGPVLTHPSSFVAVVSNEDDEGAGGCDLNGDTHFGDRVFRWVAASDPAANVLPVTDSARLLAVRDILPGGSGGMIAAGSVFVIAVDEAADERDHDGQPGTNRVLLGAHAPSSTGQGWNFQHGSGTTTPVAVTWMADDARSATRFHAAITEEMRGVDLNGDSDLLDSVPTFPSVITGNRLGFPGVGIAVQANNAGITTAGGYAFYRVSEAADGGRDRNGDGDANDQVLQRVRLDGGDGPTFMGSLNTLSTLSLGVGLDGAKFGALIYQESLHGLTGNDLNQDGDGADFVVRYFRLP